MTTPTSPTLPPGRPRWRWVAIDAAVWGTLALIGAASKIVRGQDTAAHLLAESVVMYLPAALLAPAVALLAARARPALFAGETAAARARGALLLAAGAVGYVVVAAVAMDLFQGLLPWAPRETNAGLPLGTVVVRYVLFNTTLYVGTVAAALAYVNGREAQERAVRAAQVQAELKVQLAEARLHALAAQLQPHFLFNALHAISALVRHDPKHAEQLIARLSELLREMLDTSDRVEVPLRDELAFLQKYVDIQEARFGDRLRVAFDVAPDACDAAVPRLLLQPLVENAVRHGIARRSAPGRVLVRATCDDGWLTLAVEDDGVGLPPGGAPREGVGLHTTRARLAHLHGAAATFDIAPAPGGGTRCTVRIPYRPAHT